MISAPPNRLRMDFSSDQEGCYINEQGDVVIIEEIDNFPFTYKATFKKVIVGDVRQGTSIELGGDEESAVEEAERMLIPTAKAIMC